LSVWRQQLREGKLGHPSAPVLNFAQAVVMQTQALVAPEVPLPMSGHPAAPSRRQKHRSPSMNGELIEIALPNGMVVRVGAEVDQAALGRVATITAVNYAGDEGGIMCRLEIPPTENAVYVSITHLRFDPRLPVAREITAYQKHRVKHLKHQKQ
jgi:hypothetical protein